MERDKKDGAQNKHLKNKHLVYDVTSKAKMGVCDYIKHMHIFADEGSYIDNHYTMDVTTGRRKNRELPEWQRMPEDNGGKQSGMRREMCAQDLPRGPLQKR